MGKEGYGVINRVLVTFLGVVAATLFSTWVASAAQGDVAPTKQDTAATSASSETTQHEPVFAIINGKSVTVREFKGLLAETMRGRFFHGAIPEGKAEELNKEVGDLLIQRELLAAEAERRGVRPDPARFNKVLADLDERYVANSEWIEQRDQLLPLVKINIDRQSMVEQLEQIVRNVPQPTLTEVRSYYDKRPDLFTEPERLNLSIILLKVNPNSTQQEWDQARERAKKIVSSIKNGVDFAEQARTHSQDDSAANGGSMGYLHGGMLPRGLEEKTDQLKDGVINDPITTLEGIVVARVDERIPAKLREFVAVQDRARDLLMRDRAGDAWEEVIRHLRTDATIKIVTPQLTNER